MQTVLCWKVHLQSGFVGGGVVGQPTTVSQALHHVEAKNRNKNCISLEKHNANMLTLLVVLKTVQYVCDTGFRGFKTR